MLEVFCFFFICSSFQKNCDCVYMILKMSFYLVRAVTDRDGQNWKKEIMFYIYSAHNLKEMYFFLMRQRTHPQLKVNEKTLEHV